MKKSISILWYIIIGLFLYIISFVNIEKIIALDFSNFYVISFLLFFFFSIIFTIIWKIKKSLFSSEIKYIIQFILFACILLLPWFFINHHFLAENLWDNNLYLRIYWKLAMWYFAMALIISPILQFVKHPIWREHLILSRKILWILSAIFFLKHWLEYFWMEYVFQQKYHMDTPYLDYVINNLKTRYDAISGLVAWVVMVILWLTSNKFSVSFLWKKWKKLQWIVFPWFILSSIHVAFSSRFEEFYIFLIWLVVIARLVAYLNRKQRRSSWKIIWYRCIPCWYIYDEKVWDLDSWIVPWTKFEDIPDDWRCPVCGVTKDDFEPIFEGDEELLNAIIFWYKMITDDVLELKLKIEKKLKVIPWQFANIVMKDENWEFKRSYSVVEQKWNILTFAIKLKQWWRWWEFLKKVTIWHNLKTSGIFWKFVLKNTENPKIFIATWTWLSPIMNMIHSWLKWNKNFLLFWVANKKDLFYLNKIQKNQNLISQIFLSREEVEWFEHWRIDLTKYNFPKNTEFYICWNPWLVNNTKKYLQEKGYKNIYSEEF